LDGPGCVLLLVGDVAQRLEDGGALVGGHVVEEHPQAVPVLGERKRYEALRNGCAESIVRFREL
jgi:hypothetical protein